MREANRRSNRVNLSLEGRTVTIRTYTGGTEDRHGDAEPTQTGNSPYTVPAITENEGGSAQRDADQAGESLDYDLSLLIRDDAGPVADGVLAGAGESEPATQVDLDGQTHTVVRHFDLDDGRVALEVARR